MEELRSEPMEITIGTQTVEGMVPITVQYYEVREGFGWKAEVQVWVPWSDSCAELHRLAGNAARDFLSRAISAHADAGHPPPG